MRYKLFILVIIVVCNNVSYAFIPNDAFLDFGIDLNFVKSSALNTETPQYANISNKALNVAYDMGIGCNIGVGYAMSRYIAPTIMAHFVKAEFTASDTIFFPVAVASVDTGEVRPEYKIQSGLLGLAFEYNTGGYLSPFINAAIGIANISLKEQSGNSIIYYGDAGVNIALNYTVAFYVKYTMSFIKKPTIIIKSAVAVDSTPLGSEVKAMFAENLQNSSLVFGFHFII